MLLSGHSVKETAAILDYSDPFLFSRKFRKATGVSPREYCRNNIIEKASKVLNNKPLYKSI